MCTPCYRGRMLQAALFLRSTLCCPPHDPPTVNLPSCNNPCQARRKGRRKGRLVQDSRFQAAILHRSSGY